MAEPTGINLAPYDDAVAGLTAAGIEVREIWHGQNRAIYMPDSRGTMQQTNILAVIQRWRELK